MKIFAASALLLASPMAFAEVGGFIEGGLSVASYELEDSDDDGLDLDTGTGFNLRGGIRFSPGIELQASFMTTKHNGGDFLSNNSVVSSFDGDAKFSDLRAGVFYAPPIRSVVGFRVGGGYEKQSFDLEFPGVNLEIDSTGYFVEGAVLVNVGKVVTFDVGGRYLAMDTDTTGSNNSGDKDGAEFHGIATFHVGAVDIGVGYRVLAMHTKYDGIAGGNDYKVDEDTGEFRATIGGSWGFPKSRRP